MRKIIILLAALVFIVSLSGCDKEEPRYSIDEIMTVEMPKEAKLVNEAEAKDDEGNTVVNDRTYLAKGGTYIWFSVTNPSKDYGEFVKEISAVKEVHGNNTFYVNENPTNKNLERVVWIGKEGKKGVIQCDFSSASEKGFTDKELKMYEDIMSSITLE